MANINLISARRAERVRLAKLTRGLLLATVAAAGLGALAVLGMIVRYFGTAGAVAEVDRKLVALQPKIDQIERDQAEQARLQPKLITLTQAQGSTRRWSGIMEGFRKVVPADTWLTNVAVEGNEESKSLRINGVSSSLAHVGETMFRLSLQPQYFKKVTLRNTQTARAGESERMEFELAADLYLPELEAKAKEKKDAAETK